MNNNQDNQDQKDQNDSQDRGVNEPNRSEQKQRKSFSKHVIGGVVGILVVLLIIVGVLGYRYFDNSTIMLLNLMKRLNPSKITIAGFDGFRTDWAQNYADSSYQNNRHIKCDPFYHRFSECI